MVELCGHKKECLVTFNVILSIFRDNFIQSKYITKKAGTPFCYEGICIKSRCTFTSKDVREFWHPVFFSNVGGLYSCSTQCIASSALVVTGVEPFDRFILPTLTQCTCWRPRRITSIREIRKLTSWILNSFVHQNL